MARTREWVYAWLFLSPAMILLVAFTYWPAVGAWIDSLYSTPRGKRPARFVGLENYETMIADPGFWKALTNSLIFAAVTIPLSVAIALIMGLWVDSKIRGRGFVRMAYFAPTVLPLIAVANIWMFFYTPGFGLIDQIRGLFDLPEMNWLGDPDLALGSIMVVTVWKEAGFFMIFYLAALQTLPPNLREAAAIEGASRWTFFWRVTLPLLMPTTLFVSVNAVINSFRLVDHVYAMTGGGPDNASTLLLFYIYETAFKFWDTAYASAMTIVLLAILGLLAIGQFFLLDKRVHYR